MIDQKQRQPFAPGTLFSIIQLANPAFVVVAVVLPTGALVYALASGSLSFLNFVHVLTGGLWMGIDLFMGFVLGPVLGGTDPPSRAAVFRRLVPRTTFLMPVLAGVTTTAGMQLALKMGYPLSSPKVIVALVITAILMVQGFGLLLPNEVRVFRQLLSDKPDVELISRLGMRTAKLGGLQGVFQVAIIFVMATFRM